MFGQDVELAILAAVPLLLVTLGPSPAWMLPALKWAALLFVGRAALRWLVSALRRPLRGPVVITGCDTGFGHMTAKQLAVKGIPVYAGCLTPAGVASLTDFARSHSLPLHPSLLVRDLLSVRWAVALIY